MGLSDHKSLSSEVLAFSGVKGFLNTTSDPRDSDADGLQTPPWEILVQLPDARAGIEKIFFKKM